MSVLLPNSASLISGQNNIGATFSDGALNGTAGANLQTGVWGSTIPISMGFRKVSTVVLWAGPERKVNIKSTSTNVGNIVVNETRWDVVRTFAVSLGERLNPGDPAPSIRRIWANGIVVWQSGDGVPIDWNNITSSYDVVGQFLDGTFLQFQVPPGVTVTNSIIPGTIVQSTIDMRFYDGSEDQLPDQSILDDLGPLAPSYRGLMYCVIDNLAFGTGDNIDTTALDTSHVFTSTTKDQSVSNNFPVIEVELVDDASSVVTKVPFQMLDDSPSLFASPMIVPNWADRTLVTVDASNAPAPAFIATYDIDTAAQLTWAPIALGGGGDIGTANSDLAMWDTINNVVYTSRSGNFLCSLNLDGTIVDTFAGSTNFDLAPANVDNSTITVAKPALTFPHTLQGDLDYILNNGELWPCMLSGGHDYTVAFLPDDASGSIKDFINPTEFYQNTSNALSIKGFGLFNAAVLNHSNFQDCAFIVAEFGNVDIVYVTASFIGGHRVSNIISRQTIYTAIAHSGGCTAVIDTDGNVIVEDITSNVSLGHNVFTKFHVDFLDTPDFTIAPGFRGTMPVVNTTTPIYVTTDTDSLIKWQGHAATNSELSQKTLINDDVLYNLQDGTHAVVGTFSASGSSGFVWDSANGIEFWRGAITGETFTGTGLLFTQLQQGLGGNVETVGDVLADVSKFVGYTSGNIDVDTRLTDEVPGVLIVKQYDLASLFNDIGALYNFAYVNAGGKLSFRSNVNTPIPAETTWTITAQLTNGETATIGTVTYTFKAVPTAPFDVQIGALKEDTAANFLAAIMADLSIAAPANQDPTSSPGFFAGTTKNVKVDASKDASSTTDNGFTGVDVTAVVPGASGNSIPCTTTGSGQAFPHPTLTLGTDPPAAALTLTVDDLAAVNENQLTQQDAIVTTITPPTQGQQAAAVDYFALEQNYLPMVQTFIPDDMGGTVATTGATTVTYDVPFVISTTEAYQRVSRTAIGQADNEITQNFRLSQEYLLLEPSDIVTIVLPPFAYTVRLDEATFNGDWSTSFSAINYSFRTDVPVNTSDVGGPGASIDLGTVALPVVVDAPMQDPRFTTVPGVIDLFDGLRCPQTGFSQGSLNMGTVVSGVLAGSMTSIMTTSKDVKWATLASPMSPATEPYYRTTEDVVNLTSKTIAATDLASASYEDFVAGKNCLLIGSPGNWEYVYFRDVVQTSSKGYTLTGLIRAQRGTELATTHGASDIVLLVSSVATGFASGALAPKTQPSADVGQVQRYVGAAIPAKSAGTALDVTIEGLVLYPFSPCHLKATLVAGNDLDLAWTRRDRQSVAFVTDPTPMSEVAELYDVEILSGSTVVRTAAGLTTNAYVYTSAHQTADGFTPGSVATLKFRVYQNGELGRGFPRTETVNVH